MTDSSGSKLEESLHRFSGILTEVEIKQLLTLQEKPLPTGIRINQLKTTQPAETIRALSDRYGWQAAPIPFCDNGWTLTQTETSPGTTIEHRLGQYYLQDAASMVPVSLFDLEHPAPLILDMAASPGGKTTHLIDRTLDQGFILANDASKGRVAALRSVLANWGGTNLAVTNYPGEAFGRWFPETFDLVLLDAPCSMENLRPTPNHPLRETTPDERQRLQERQIQLLTSGLQALKVGGQLVYATCSLAPEEDEAVVDALLKAHRENITIVDVSEKFTFQTPGLTEFNGRPFDPALRHALRLWPHLTGMSGFFCVLITKIGSIPVETEPSPSRDFSKTDLLWLRRYQQEALHVQVTERYGFPFAEVLQNQHLELYQRFDQIFLIPTSYVDHFRNLPYEYIGMPLGRLMEGVLEPSPEFISRFGHLFTEGKIKIEDNEVAQWIAGRDIRHPAAGISPKGQYLLVTDSAGRNLGLGKLLPKRLRNMLPRASI